MFVLNAGLSTLRLMAPGAEKLDAASVTRCVLWSRQNGGVQRESEAPVEAPQPGTFVAKKSKAAAKQGTGTTQWAILQQSGIAPDDIPEFRSACRGIAP